jgi:hypothetical protein
MGDEVPELVLQPGGSVLLPDRRGGVDDLFSWTVIELRPARRQTVKAPAGARVEREAERDDVAAGARRVEPNAAAAQRLDDVKSTSARSVTSRPGTSRRENVPAAS